MVRALACHARGRGFDPRHSRQIQPSYSKRQDRIKKNRKERDISWRSFLNATIR